MKRKASSKVSTRKKRAQLRVKYKVAQNDNGAVDELFDYLLSKLLDKNS